MTATIEHRGPDASGVFASAAYPVRLGHTRLSIRDLTTNGAQPMSSNDGRWTMVYNGEVYNQTELRQRIPGVSWRGHSDTETVLELIGRVGVPEAVERLVGMFALAAWDELRGQLWLARDRLGQKPLAYLDQPGIFAFGSEVRVLEAIHGLELSVSDQSVSDVISFGHTLGNRSIYDEIMKVEPGATQCFDVGERRLAPAVHYWNFDALIDANSPRISCPASAKAMVHDQLADAVSRRLVADVPVGVFLSGGIDSTLIAALAVESSQADIQTFTVRVDSQDDESSFAAKAAQELGTDHTVLDVSGAEAASIVPSMASIYDEPFGDSSQIPTYLLCERASEHVKVILGGDGGDEMFGGYNRHVQLPKFSRATQRIPRRLAVAASSGASRLSRATGARLFQQVGKYSGIPLVQNKVRKAAKVIAANHMELVSAARILAGNDALNSHMPSSRLPALGGPATDVRSYMSHDLLNYLPDDILVKVDRASMAVGLEARSPFLDHRVWALSQRLDNDLLTNGTKGKLILRSLLADYVSPDVFDRPKTGFGIPLSDWLRGPLKEWASDHLSVAALERRNDLDASTIQSLWQIHQSGAADLEHDLWPVVMLSAWLAERKK